MNVEGESNLYNWQNVTNKNGKRVSNESPGLYSQKKKILIQPNRYDLLSDDDDDDIPETRESNMEANETTTTSIPKPPPLIIPGVVNISDMITYICTIIPKKEFSYKSLKDGQIRLIINNVDSYRKVVKQLEIGKLSYHTYQLKQERSYKVVLKGLHYSTPIEDIKSEITQLGHSVRNIYNVKSRLTKQPLPMFFVDLEPSANNKKIYELRHLNNAIIKIEAPRQTNDMIQCYRCQEFGHTKTYCRKPFKCVKCSQMHSTAECKKPKDALPTCVHCQQHHTANYKGCIVYQQLTRNKPTASSHTKESVNTNKQNTSNVPDDNNNNKESYSNILKGRSTNNNTNTQMDNIERLLSKQIELTNTLLNMMSLLIEKLCK